MISSIKGQISDITPTSITLITAGGVGYDINISLATFSDIKDDSECSLHTVMIVREDAQLLFGFSRIHEKSVFILLTKVSGVGPSIARMVLSYLSPGETRHAIANGDVDTLKKVKGVGQKLAEKIIVELKDKVGDINPLEKMVFKSAYPQNHKADIINDAIDALIALGFSKKSIEGIVKTHAAGCDSVESLIKLTLKTAK